MTVQEMAERLNLSTVCLSEPEREIEGGYIGDLLSWVMCISQHSFLSL